MKKSKSWPAPPGPAYIVVKKVYPQGSILLRTTLVNTTSRKDGEAVYSGSSLKYGNLIFITLAAVQNGLGAKQLDIFGRVRELMNGQLVVLECLK
jgi:hypothetical protein